MHTPPFRLPSRFPTLILVNAAGTLLLGILADEFRPAPPWDLLGASIMFCLNPVLVICMKLGVLGQRSFLLFVFLLGAGPVLWAASIELLLRRFVDRPKDSSGE